jgi:hypothetical protein
MMWYTRRINPLRRVHSISAFFACLVASAVFLPGCWGQSPPKDQDLINRFTENRSTYEELRSRLETDEKLKEVATWGFRTFDSPLVLQPPTPDLSVVRYKEYLSILGLVKASTASRSQGSHPRICISAWASGWAADTRHIAICWLPDEAIRDATSGGGAPTGTGIKRVKIDGSWYLQKDC